MLVGLDSNVLAYLAGVGRSPDDGAKIDAARALLATLSGRAQCVAPVQALGELFVVLIRAGASREEARTIVLRFQQSFALADSAESALLSALDLAAAHGLQFWDSLILNAAAEAGCALLLSEDIQDGFVWRGVTVANPFAVQRHGRLAALLEG